MPPTAPGPTLAAVHQAHASDVRKLVRRFIHAQDAGDVEQQTWVEIASALPRYNPALPLKPWLNTIVLRTIFGHLRRRGKGGVLLLGELASEIVRDRRSNDEELLGARELLGEVLDSMTPQQREIVLRHLHNGEATKRIAKDLGISTRGVQKSLEAARDAAGDVMKRHEAIERRVLGRKRTFMLPIGLALHPQAWIARMRSTLRRALAWANAAPVSFAAAAGMVVALGAIVPPPQHLSALAKDPASKGDATAMAPSALPSANDAAASDAPAVTSSEAVAQPAPGMKSATEPSSTALSARSLAAELSSLQGIQAMLDTDPAAALAALELHEKTFPRERLHAARGRIEMLVRAKTSPPAPAGPVVPRLPGKLSTHRRSVAR